jgi:peptidoglycan/LPS O-acetylase OafA/YrhL
MAKKYFDNLDGLRFLLALAVFSSHSMFGVTLAEISPFDFVDRLILGFSTGATAVSFFFVLSGFLITYLMLEENDETGRLDLKKFYVRRTLRIWPLYYAVLIFGFFIYPIIKQQFGYENLIPFSKTYQFLFLSNFDSIRVAELGLKDFAPSMTGITWSVAIEEQFYLVWPLLFLLLKGKKFYYVILPVIFISWFCRSFIFGNAAHYYHTVSVASDLAIGALAAMLSFYNASFVYGLRKTRKIYIILFYLFSLIFFLYAEDFLSPFFFKTFFRLIITLIFAMVILEQNYCENSFFKFGNWKGISAMGKYSYSLYMLHPIGIQVSIVAFRFMYLDRADGFATGILYVLIALVSSLSLSYFSYRYIESYFLNLKKKFYSFGV